MATTFTVDRLLSGVPAVMVVWGALLNGEAGAAVEMTDFPDKTVTIEGTFSVGGSCTLEGSNDGTNFYPLTDPQGTAITKTAAGIELVTEDPLKIRPRVTAGDGGTSIQVRLKCRRATR